jgi:hypothetical protein
MLNLLNVISGVVTIGSFGFAIWIWLDSTHTVRALNGAIRTMHEIATTAIRESEYAETTSEIARERHADRAHGYFTGIRAVATQFLPKGDASFLGVGDYLLERGIVRSKRHIDDIERSKETTEVWLITPDLKPDTTSAETGETVSSNLKRGVRYVYCVPGDLPNLPLETSRLYENIGKGIPVAELRDIAKVIPITASECPLLFPRHQNLIFFFRDRLRDGLPRCFEEVLFTKVSERGLYWQEHNDLKTQEFRRIVAAALPSERASA